MTETHDAINTKGVASAGLHINSNSSTTIGGGIQQKNSLAMLIPLLCLCLAAVCVSLSRNYGVVASPTNVRVRCCTGNLGIFTAVSLFYFVVSRDDIIRYTDTPRVHEYCFICGIKSIWSSPLPKPKHARELTRPVGLAPPVGHRPQIRDVAVEPYYVREVEEAGPFPGPVQPTLSERTHRDSCTAAPVQEREPAARAARS